MSEVVLLKGRTKTAVGKEKRVCLVTLLRTSLELVHRSCAFGLQFVELRLNWTVSDGALRFPRGPVAEDTQPGASHWRPWRWKVRARQGVCINSR